MPKKIQSSRTEPRAKLSDIAKKCNVSSTTVSFVLRGVETNRVSPAKRDEIVDAAENLRYRPNRVARALASKESGTLGLVLDTLAIPFYAEIAQAIIAHAKDSGYSVLVSSALETSGSHESRIADERQTILNLLDRGVDGLVICSALRVDPVITEIEDMRIPFVLALRDVRRGPKNLTLDYVGSDNERGGYLLAEHILKLGHKRVAIVKGDEETTSAHDRLTGTLQAFNDYGVEPDPKLIVNGGYRRQISFRVVRELLEKEKKVTAIIAHSDIMAMGVLEALRDNKIKVPEQVAVVGFDNSEMATLPGIDLTTVAQEKSLLGKTAVDILVEKIRLPTHHMAKRITLTPALVIRNSCGYHCKRKPRGLPGF